MQVAKYQWSAMSVPLAEGTDRWAVVWNSEQSKERQRASILEEFWHILLGHKLTRITKIADIYGRTFEANEEHDAFYLAAATLLPATTIETWITQQKEVSELAQKFGTTIELVEYRIKRLGLWRKYKRVKVSLEPEQ